jgi:hypothetical protein
MALNQSLLGRESAVLHRAEEQDDQEWKNGRQLLEIKSSYWDFWAGWPARKASHQVLHDLLDDGILMLDGSRPIDGALHMNHVLSIWLASSQTGELVI